MSKQLFLDGADCDSSMNETRKAQQPASASARHVTSCWDSRGSMSSSLRILDGQPTLPAELFIEIVEQLAIPQSAASFCLDQGALKTLASLALLNETFNRVVTPNLYRRIRLATPSAIRSLHITLSHPPRGTYLSSFVKYFLTCGSTNEATSCPSAIITLIRESVEYVHIDNWPDVSCASDLSESIASIRNLRKLAAHPRESSLPAIPPFNNWPILESMLLSVTNAIWVIRRFLSDISHGVGIAPWPNLSIYCVASGTLLPRLLYRTVKKHFQQLNLAEKDLPPFKIIMLFPETSTFPADIWEWEQPALSDRWYCLPVQHRLGNLDSPDFHQWFLKSVENVSFWEINPIPMEEWVTWVKEKSQPTQDVLDMQNTTTRVQSLANQD